MTHYSANVTGFRDTIRDISIESDAHSAWLGEEVTGDLAYRNAMRQWRVHHWRRGPADRSSLGTDSRGRDLQGDRPKIMVSGWNTPSFELTK